MVICDMCNVDFTLEPNSNEIGGFLFGSNGVCSRCTSRIRTNAARFGELGYIKAEALPNETFKSFILRMRNGNNKVKFYA